MIAEGALLPGKKGKKPFRYTVEEETSRKERKGAAALPKFSNLMEVLLSMF